MTDFDVDVVKDFILSRGGKIKNNDLVSHFKTVLNDPRQKDTNRAKFKSIVNTIAIVKLDTTGEKVLVLKKKYRDDAPSETFPQRDETPKKLEAPKAKLKAAFVPRKQSEDITDEQEPIGAEPSSDVSAAESSLLSEIQKELSEAGLKDESCTDEGAVRADESPTSEDVFVDAVSQHSSPSLSTYEDTSQSYPSEGTADPKTETISQETTAIEAEQAQDKPDATVEIQTPVNEPAETHKEPDLPSPSEAAVETTSVPPKEPTPPTSNETAEHAVPQERAPLTKDSRDLDTERSTSSLSSVSSREPSIEKKIEGPSLETPARAQSSESLGPKEPPISVKDRAKHLNKITSQVDLQGVQRAPDKLLKRGEGREGSEESDIISLNQTEREWMIHAAKSDYQALSKLLNKNPYLARRKDFTSGYTALHWACKHGNADVVKMLCGTEGVEVNAKSNGGYTPLHLAAMQGHEEIIEILVAVYGADTNIRDYNGKKAKQYLKNSASSRTQQLLQARRHSVIQAGSGASSNFRRSGSYSAKIRSAGHFGIQASSAVRTSWTAKSQSRSPSPSPKSSHSASRKASLRDEELMPPPQGLPPRRRRNKKGSSKDHVKEYHVLEKTESDPCLSSRGTDGSVRPSHASDHDMTRAGSDSALTVQAGGQPGSVHHSVSYTSVV